MNKDIILSEKQERIKTLKENYENEIKNKDRVIKQMSEELEDYKNRLGNKLYDPATLSEVELNNDWRVVCHMYYLYKSNLSELSLNKIIMLAEKVINEFSRRGIRLNKSDFLSHSELLYDVVYREMSATTTSSPGVDSIQGSEIAKKKVISQEEQGDEVEDYAEWDLSTEKFNPPKAAQDNAQKVIMWKRKYPTEIKGMTQVGWTRAQQLASGKPISLDIVKRMAQFNRHRKNSEIAPEFKATPWKDAGYVAWLGWGGTEGIDWAIKVAEDNKDSKNMADDDFGEDQESFANEQWQKTWQHSFPKDGSGRFVFQHHWRGLTEEESKLNETALLDTNNSLHGDLRFSFDPETLWGFTVFEGEAKDNKDKDGSKLIYYSNHKNENRNLQGTFKLEMPSEWLKVDNLVSSPGEVGATSKMFSKFFILDGGDYDIGVWREHMFEIFFKGSKLKGRALIEYAPLDGTRKWIIDFPVDQTPYAESHKIDTIVKELKEKNQKYLVWAKPGEKPELIEVDKYGTGKN